MVGAFGNVQVMDWGLAKASAGPEPPGEPRSSEARVVPTDGADAGRTIDHREPGESPYNHTRAGTVLERP